MTLCGACHRLWHERGGGAVVEAVAWVPAETSAEMPIETLAEIPTK